MKFLKVTLIVILSIFFNTYSQPSKIMNAAEIKLELEKLNVLGSVLYIAAHPDDENTAALAYFSLGQKYRTGYLSLTRGDGGQNLIGPEKGDLMGVIRTHELLEGRKIDGVEQFFTRAVDFGYSKTTEETLDFWGREKILEDVIWVIRKFKPDVIVTRFPPGDWQTHGHHLASAILAVDAFNKSADVRVFPDQLSKVEPWQAKRIVWDSWLPRMQNFDGDMSSFIVEDIGGYSSFLGKSFTEISAESRTKHKSQGFGAGGKRGKQEATFKFLQGDTNAAKLFDGIETNWTRVNGSERIADVINKINSEFTTNEPSASVDDLIRLFSMMNMMPENYWINYHKKRVKKLIQSCSGIWIEAIASEHSYTPGDSADISFSVINRSSIDAQITEVKIEDFFKETIDTKLLFNDLQLFKRKVLINENQKYSQPYWLTKQKSNNNFQSISADLTTATKGAVLNATFLLNINGESIQLSTPLLYRWRDRVKGELYRDLEIRPPVVINAEEENFVFSNSTTKEMKINLKSFKDNINGTLLLSVINGWIVTPSEIDFQIDKKLQIKELYVKVQPESRSTESILELKVVINGQVYNHSLKEIDYDHIPINSVLFPAEVKLIKVNTDKVISKIGYIEGAGDDIVEVLQILGYEVDILDEDKISQNNLSIYDAIITGIRAYNTNDYLKHTNNKLLEYVSNGGRMIVQYNVAFGLVTPNIGPYDFKLSRDRVTDENAAANIMDETHPILNYPNIITNVDFKDWVQERGLYFADEWDSNFTPLIQWNDAGEDPKEGALLFTEYGKGEFIYTGISFFRQLPAGVPGAIRLFVNLISGEK